MNQENTTQFNTPVLLIGFNRPDTTQKVFDQVAKIKPKQLFMFVDGPRVTRLGEDKQCEEVRNIIKQVDWDCEVKTLFLKENAGIRGVMSGPDQALNWFFENVEKGIILEDDCIANKSFFYFCQEIINTFNTGVETVEENKIMMVSGNNFQGGKKRGDASYYFSIYPNTWGWATWKKSWKLQNFDIKDLQKFKDENKIAQYFRDEKTQQYWLDIFNKMSGGKTDTWDYRWLFAMWNNGGLSVVPNKNLISNIGFDNRATHTKNADPKISNLKTEELEFPIQHPIVQQVDREADLHIFQTIFMRKRSFFWKVSNKIRKWVRILQKSLKKAK